MKKFALIVIILAMAGYVGYRVYRAGSFNAFLQELKQMGQATPTPTASPTRVPTPRPTAAVQPSATPAPPGAAAAVLATMNTRRSDAGVGALTTNAILQREAQEHAADMAARNYFNHTAPDGVTFQQRMSGSGYPSSTLAENIGLTSGGPPADVVAIWMDSEAHRANLLNPALVGVGVGVADGMYQGQKAFYVVAIFGDVR